MLGRALQGTWEHVGKNWAKLLGLWYDSRGEDIEIEKYIWETADGWGKFRTAPM